MHPEAGPSLAHGGRGMLAPLQIRELPESVLSGFRGFSELRTRHALVFTCDAERKENLTDWWQRPFSGN